MPLSSVALAASAAPTLRRAQVVQRQAHPPHLDALRDAVYAGLEPLQ